MDRRKTHQSPPVSAHVRVGAYTLEVGTTAGSFAQFEPAKERENAQALAASLAAEPSRPGRPVAAVESFNESAAAVTKRAEQADDLFRAAVEGRLDDLRIVNAEIDVLLAVLKRLDRAGRFEEELRLLRSLHGLLALSLRWLDLIRALRRGLAASQAAANPAAEAWVQHELGALHLAAGDARTAARRFAEALRLQQQLGDVTGRCATRHNLDCAERELARASAPPGGTHPARRWALTTAFVLVALVLGVAAGRFQPAGNDDADPTQTELTTTVDRPRPPEALDDAATTDEDTALTFPTATLLRNDDDLNGDDLTVIAVERVEQRTHGRVALVDDEVVYTPARNYTGPARFRYRISDGRGGTAAGLVRIAVEPVNDAPQARPDTLRLLEVAPATVDVLANDRDVDGGRLVVLGQTNGRRGSVSCSADGECTYTPDSRDVGLDTFTYTVGDGSGAKTIGLVTVMLAAERLPEVSIGDAEPVTEPGEAVFTLTLSAQSSSTVEVSWETREHPDGASAEAKDFGQAGDTVIFEPGETEATITIQIYADGAVEGDETFFVQLLGAVGAELGRDIGTGTIRDPDPEPSPVPKLG